MCRHALGSAYIPGGPLIYSMSKGALNSMQSALIPKLLEKKIRMNSVAPVGFLIFLLMMVMVMMMVMMVMMVMMMMMSCLCFYPTTSPFFDPNCSSRPCTPC